MRKLKPNFSEAELTVSYKAPKNTVTINDEHQAEAFLYSIWDTALINLQEQLYVLYLNQKHELLCWRCLHTGSITHTIVDLRLLFGFALGCGATNMIIAHNHPSGKLEPSKADKELTLKVKEAGKLLNICLLDHLILGGRTSLSFRSIALIC
jgi:DNA repair protein RadC